MLILTIGIACALVVRMFWRLILEVAVLFTLAGIFVGILTLVELVTRSTSG